MAEIIYHGTCDTTFAPRVEHVPAREIFPEYYRLWLNAEVMLTLTHKQLCQIAETIQEAQESAEQDRVNAAFRKYVESQVEIQNRGVHPVFAPILESICPTESDLEQARRMR